MLDADLVTWEAVYSDGTSDREKDGRIYSVIDRNKLQTFKLISPDDTVLFETYCPDGMTGNNFIYRRRVSMPGGERYPIFVLGWMPKGPAFAVDVISKQFRVLETGFDTTDPDLYPPVPMDCEPYLKELLAV